MCTRTTLTLASLLEANERAAMLRIRPHPDWPRYELIVITHPTVMRLPMLRRSGLCTPSGLQIARGFLGRGTLC